MTKDQQQAIIEAVDRVQQSIRAVEARKRQTLLAEQEVDIAEVKLAQARGALKILIEQITGERSAGMSYETAIAMFDKSERRSLPISFSLPFGTGNQPCL